MKNLAQQKIEAEQGRARTVSDVIIISLRTRENMQSTTKTLRKNCAEWNEKQNVKEQLRIITKAHF